VGLAALQVLQALGASAICTAGSPSKRTLLRSLGVVHVVGSRDTHFTEAVAQLGGVDVVLNSLTSPGMVAGSLAVLRPGGRAPSRARHRNARASPAAGRTSWRR
jgi:NADPH:quinone reductase-like Zn-dependent oxidoreductase